MVKTALIIFNFVIMGQFSNYPVASSSDYDDATTFLIQNEDGETKLADLETLKSTFFCETLCATVTIPTAEVLTLSTTPVEIVAAQGAGTAIEVISAVVKLDFNSAAYTTQNEIRLITTGATVQHCDVEILDATVTTTRKLVVIEATGTTDTQIIENAALLVKSYAGDPFVGDSDIQVWVYYRILSV